MRIWLVTIGEPWPIDGINPRLHRTGSMAFLYAGLGDQVVWFNNTFDHYKKKHRFPLGTTIEPLPNLTLIGLHGKAYKRNVSLERINHHREVATEWERISENLPKPDIIVASMPPLELSRAAVRFGRRNHIPVVVDIRDLWPDIFLEVFPKGTKWIGKVAIAPFYKMLDESVRDASAISGVSEHAVDWALSSAGKHRSKYDGQLPLAYSPDMFSSSEITAAREFWDRVGIRAGDTELTICFFGTFTPRIDLDVVLSAARQIPASMKDKIRLVLCGIGALADKVKACSSDTPGVIAPGWLNGAQINVLMQRSHVGLLPYPDTFAKIVPNKVFDYLSGGLPVLTCLRGVTSDLIIGNQAGWMYNSGDAEDLVRMLVKLSQNRSGIAEAAICSAKLSKHFTAKKIYGEFRERLKSIIEAESKPQ